MPTIVPAPGNEWYFIPFLQERQVVPYDLDRYMFSMGALTAVAYCLHMTDLHLENVAVDGEKPVIIDPEFILANFNGGDSAARLRNTGFLSHNVHLSALRGGDVAKSPMFTLDVHQGANGSVECVKRVDGFRNGMRDLSSPALADPAEFRDVVAQALRQADVRSHIAILNEFFDISLTRKAIVDAEGVHESITDFGPFIRKQVEE